MKLNLRKKFRSLKIGVNFIRLHLGGTEVLFSINRFLIKLQKFSLVILLLNFIFVNFFYVEPGIDKVFIVANFNTLTPLDDAKFQSFFVFSIYFSKIFLFLRGWYYIWNILKIVGIVEPDLIIKCDFEIRAEKEIQALEELLYPKQKKDFDFYMLNTIKIFLYLIGISLLFLIPGASDFIMSRSIC